MIIRKWPARIPYSDEQWEWITRVAYALNGTCGDRDLDARYAAELAELVYPIDVWEGEGGSCGEP